MNEALFEFMSYIDQIATFIMYNLSLATPFEPWPFSWCKLIIMNLGKMHIFTFLVQTIDFH